MIERDELLEAAVFVLPVWDDDPSLYDGTVNLYPSRGIDPDPYPKRLSLEGMGN
jgi:hypothetical protein